MTHESEQRPDDPPETQRSRGHTNHIPGQRSPWCPECNAFDDEDVRASAASGPAPADDAAPAAATPSDDEKVEQASEDSFPASDPPPWTLGTEPPAREPAT